LLLVLLLLLLLTVAKELVAPGAEAAPVIIPALAPRSDAGDAEQAPELRFRPAKGPLRHSIEGCVAGRRDIAGADAGADA
jgi:hypothetical protein